MKKVGYYGCLTKKNCQLILSTMARNSLNIHHSQEKVMQVSTINRVFSKELFEANFSFQIFQLTEGFGVQIRVFNFLIMKVYVRIISGNFHLIFIER